MPYNTYIEMCVVKRSRSINRKIELDIMVDDIKPHIIGITESCANNGVTGGELGPVDYVINVEETQNRKKGTEECHYYTLNSLYQHSLRLWTNHQKWIRLGSSQMVQIAG